MRKYLTTPNGRRIPAPKPIIIGKTWTLEADFGEARGPHDGRVHGYATRADSARTYEFITWTPPDKRRAKVAQLFGNAPGGWAPMYIRQAAGRMMRDLERKAATPTPKPRQRPIPPLIQDRRIGGTPMPPTPNINKILAAHPRRCGFTDAAGQFICTGSHMGDSCVADDLTEPLYVQRVRFVDGDYAPDGTYWGGGCDPLWCGFHPSTGTRIWVRAMTRAKAVVAIKGLHPEAKFKGAGA